MASSEPEDSQPIGILKTLVEAFGKLPPLLSYGGLVFVAAFVFLYFLGYLPDLLLLIPLVAILAFIVYAFVERRFELDKLKAEQAHELAKQKQEFEHAERVADSESSRPPAPKPETPPAESDEVPADEWERRYLEHLMTLCGYPPSMALVDIKEAGLGGQKLALQRVFTSLDVPARVEERDRLRTASDLSHPTEDERQTREPALAAVSRPENARLVLLGGPGSGKSTLVNYLALCLAGEHLRREAVNQEHLRQHGWELSHLRLWPVRVILREYAARGLSQGQDILEFIAADLDRPEVELAGYAPHLKKRLQAEGGILLLDGLDEVDKASKVREALKGKIELFARNFPRVRVLVTSRPYAYGSGWELDRFEATRLLPFSDEQIQFFIEQWYTVMGQQDLQLGPERAEDYSKSLIRQTEHIRNLREMARHPLLLTMMVYIHRGREGGALPQRREELYRLSVVLLLDLWRRSKVIPGRETQELVEELGMDTKRLLQALSEVAFVAHRDQEEQEQTADVPGSLVAGTLYKYKSKESPISVEEIVEYVRDRAGLLEDHGRNADDTDDVYRFPHRTFQEYLAAKHLLGQADFPREITALSRERPSRWREVVLLAGAAAAETPVMQWALVDALYGRKAAPPDVMATEADWWGAFLAGQILLETDMLLDRPAIYETSLAQLQGWQKAILERGALPPLDRALAGDVLAQLGDDRPGVGTVEVNGVRLPDIRLGEEVPPGNYTIGDDGNRSAPIAKPYRLAIYPITNAQFDCFVTAKDVDHKDWWKDMPEGEKYRRRIREPRWSLPNRPREMVTWYQAIAFCQWLQHHLRQAEIIEKDEEIVLPHEYEWEVAARYAGDGKTDRRVYPWGGDEITPEHANYDETGLGETSAVGLFPRGMQPVLGLYDLSGNVWEYCRNKYDNPADEAVDSSGARRTLRGGSWFDNRGSVRAAYRDFGFWRRGVFFGFRVAARRPPSRPDH